MSAPAGAGSARETETASISIVIVAYDSAAALALSLPQLVADMEPEDELVVVDNASSDDTVAVLGRQVPHATLIRNRHNAGFAAGCNLGASCASGRLLVFLNPDALIEPGFCAAIRRPLAQGRGWDAWMGLVTAERGTVVNSAGNVVHFTGLGWAGQAGRPVSTLASSPREVPYLSGACLAVPSEVWRQEGGFSSPFFMYHEDLDFSMRVRLAGGRIGIEPSARVDHLYEFHKGGAKWRRMERNRWAMVVRTYPAPLLMLVFPALLATEVGIWLLAASGGWAGDKALATRQAVRWLPRLLSERRAIQARRQVSAVEFARWLTAELSSPFLGRPARLRPLNWGLRAYWRAARALLEWTPRRATPAARNGSTPADEPVS